MLTLRIKNQGLEDVEILKDNYFFLKDKNNILALITELHSSAAGIILVPINMYDKHAVGIIGIKDQDSLKLYYIDPANEEMPHDLARLFAYHQIEVQHIKVEQQQYSNCGPEVIENFILYLTGERLSQEEAVPYHSELLERELLDVPTGPVVLSGDSAESIPGGFI
jgi:hypothetical protein